MLLLYKCFNFNLKNINKFKGINKFENFNNLINNITKEELDKYINHLSTIQPIIPRLPSNRIRRT